MRYCIYIATLFASFAVYSVSVAALPAGDDAPTKAQQVLDRFDERFAVMDSLVFRLPELQVAATELDSVSMAVITRERVAEIDDAVEAQIRAMKARTGLEIRGQTYFRPGATISYDPDDPLVAYNGKIQAELNWNIFHSSIYKRASKIEELRLQGELRQLEYEREALDETIYLQSNIVRRRHYGRLLSVLQVHLENVELLMQTQLYLLQNGKISSDDLLKLINEQSELERQLTAIRADSTITPLPVSSSALYISVTDTTALMSCIRDQQLDLKRYELKQSLLDVQRKNIDYLQTMDIQPFVRYSYYTRHNAHNTYNLDVGVSFRIPLSVETARKRKAILAEKNVLRYELEHSHDNVVHDIEALLRDLETENNNIFGEYERMQSLKRYLRMRIDSYGNVAGEYSRIDRLQEYNAYLQAWERLLGYVWRRDCLLIDLQSCVPDESISKFLVFQELN